jgi:O-antigen ligase
MIRDRHSQAVSQRLFFAVQLLGFAALTGFIFIVFSGGKGVLFLGAILAAMGAVWLFINPYWGVLIIITAWFAEVAIVPKLVGVMLLIPLGLVILRDRDIWVLRVPQVNMFLLIGFLFLVSTLWNDLKYPVTLVPQLDQTGAALQNFVTHLGFLIFFLYFVTTRQRIEHTTWLLLGLIVVAAVTAFLPFHKTPRVDRAAAAFSLAENPNRFAFICVFATSLLWFYRLYGEKHWFKTLTLPLLFCLPLAALTTGSRSGFLQMIILVFLILKEQKGWSPAKRVGSLFFVASMGLVILLAAPVAQLTRVTSFDPAVSAPGQISLRERINHLYAAAELIASDPMFGIGIGNFSWMNQAFYGHDKEPHNSYIWALSAGGIGALALYLLLFYVTFRMLKQLEKTGPPELFWLSKGLTVNLILFLVFSAFADLWLGDFLYIILGLTLAMYYLERRHSQRLRPLGLVSNPVPSPIRS